MFAETFVHAGGTTEGHASEAHALHLIRRAIRTGCNVIPTMDGGASITWSTLRTAPGGGIREEDRSITLVPHTPVGPLTETVRAELAAVDQNLAYPCLVEGQTVIRAGLLRIPPAATARLYGRRLVTEERGRVRLTLTARLALLVARGATPPEVTVTFVPEYASLP
ncbi:hypothetical protein [Streptomyces alfalfae]